jgi:hypothetical protein
MIFVVTIDTFGLQDLMMCFFLDIVVHFLFVYLPSVILAIMAVDLSLFYIFCCCFSAKQLSFGPLYFILGQLEPD